MQNCAQNDLEYHQVWYLCLLGSQAMIVTKEWPVGKWRSHREKNNVLQ